MENEINIGVRITRETLIQMQEYIVEKGLHKYSIKPSQLGIFILKEWLENPILNKSQIIFGRVPNEPRTHRITVKLKEDENIKLYEIYVREYIRECNSVNMLINNVILQFLKYNRELKRLPNGILT